MSAFSRGFAPVLALLLSALLTAEQGRPVFGLGVLRRDGVLVPFASFNGRSWSTDWPGDARVALPIALADVPRKWWGAPGPAAAWTAWLLDGTSRPLTLEKPQQLRVFCGTRLGIRTSYQGRGADPRDPTAAKDGLAIAGDAPFQPIPYISLHSADATRMLAAIADDFNREERAAASRFVAWEHPFDEAARRERPIELETFYRARETTPSGEWLASYVEAVRRFPARPGDHDCGLITFVHGWVLERPGRRPVMDLGARITYCDRADVSFLQPFGQLLIDREPYWVYQISSWRDEVYGVSRIRPEDVRPVLAVAGGGCPKGTGPGGAGDPPGA